MAFSLFIRMPAWGLPIFAAGALFVGSVPASRADDLPLIEAGDALGDGGETLAVLGAGMLRALGDTLTALFGSTQRPADPTRTTLFEPLPKVAVWKFRESDDHVHSLAFEAGYQRVLRFRGRQSFFSELEGEAGVEYRFTLHQPESNVGPGPLPTELPADTFLLLRVSPLHASLTAVQLRPFLAGTIEAEHADDRLLDQEPEEQKLPALFRLGARLTAAFEQRLGPAHMGLIVTFAPQGSWSTMDRTLTDAGFPDTEAAYLRLPLNSLSQNLSGALPGVRRDWLGRERRVPPLQLTVRLLHRDRGAGLDSVLDDPRLHAAVLGPFREIWEGAVFLDTRF